MKKWSVGLLPIWLLAQLASAEPIIDQEFVADFGFGYVLDYPGDYMAQTFTVRNTGQIGGIGVQVAIRGYPSYQPVTDDLLLRLIKTDTAGVPDIDLVLASHTISRFDLP